MDGTSDRREENAGLLPFSALLESVTTRSWVLDRDLRILSADGGIEPLASPDAPLVTAPAQFIGARLPDCLPEPARGRWTAAAQAVLAGEQSPDLPHAADTGTICRMEARALRNAAGELDRVQLLLLEVSPEAVQAAAASRRQRTRDQLDVVRQLAVSLNHEINNPLFVVSATLEDVLAEPLTPEIQKRLEGALDAVWRVAEAVKLLQDVRQVVTTPYIPGFTMIDLEASAEPPPKPPAG